MKILAIIKMSRWKNFNLFTVRMEDLHLRRKQYFSLFGISIKKRSDPYGISGGKKLFLFVVPNNKSKFSIQIFTKCFQPHIKINRKNHFTVRVRFKWI